MFMSKEDELVRVKDGQATPAQANATWIVPNYYAVPSIACLTSSSIVTLHLNVIKRSPPNSFSNKFILS